MQTMSSPTSSLAKKSFGDWYTGQVYDEEVYDEEVYEKFPFIEVNYSKYLIKYHSTMSSRHIQFLIGTLDMFRLKEMKKLGFEFVLESKRARLGHGRDKALQYLKDNLALQDEIEKSPSVAVSVSVTSRHSSAAVKVHRPPTSAMHFAVRKHHRCLLRFTSPSMDYQQAQTLVDPIASAQVACTCASCASSHSSCAFVRAALASRAFS
ncbi:DNA repair protein recA-like protein 1 [Cucumis melo var. makuwa]|uniref:DNA repair protein recA-like protein 1 n=1 Tax=Cucumis melo var. makuwa TaxID=1194695 RepID=A0A5D3CCT7_CUCMM|nr:DNA repair protein recA-like protein 1 [Cucumis melo var. makuwa]